jgi:DNA-binding NarL/FixJ family response regulator
MQKTQPSLAELMSTRERNIITLIARGQSNEEVARDLGFSPETLKSHVKHSSPSCRREANASRCPRKVLAW